MSEGDAFEALQAMADAAARDIAGDFPGSDVAYDLWVEQLGAELIGVVDMGDSWSYVGEWKGGEWHDRYDLDHFVVVEKIIRKRQLGGGW